MMHLTLLHVSNLGVNVIFIVEAIFWGGCLHLGRWGGKNIFLGGVYFFFLISSQSVAALLLFSLVLVYIGSLL